MKSTPAILAIDYDHTIAITEYPSILGLRKGAKKYINKLYRQGHYIIIWTCREGEDINLIRDYLTKEGVLFHEINEHHPEVLSFYKNNTRKIAADLYIDDKNLLHFNLPWWFIYLAAKLHIRKIKTKFLDLCR